MSATDPRLFAALAWRDSLAEIDRLQREEGLSQNQACARLGLNPPTVSKKRAKLARGGVEALMDKRAEASGRTPIFDLTDDEARRLRWHVLRKDSHRLALEACLEEGAFGGTTAALVRGYLERAEAQRQRVHLPQSLRRAARVTAEEKAQFRGKKAAEAVEAHERRNLTFWCPVRQAEIPMGPRDMFASDDVSLNQDARFTDPDTGEVKIGRQFLVTTSTMALRILGVTGIGREKDAYRDEDKLDHMLSVVETCGLPLAWRLEQGWCTNAFGLDMGRVLKTPALTGQMWGTLPFQLEWVYKSRTKAEIEGPFDHLQSLEAHEWGDIERGRVRGEFDKGNKLSRQAKDGQLLALAKYPELAVRADGLAEACARFNAEQKGRSALSNQRVAPDELWFGSPKRECPASELWRFLPVKTCVAVKGGRISVKATHYPAEFQFRLNGEGAWRDGHGYIPTGFRVFVAFHPARPWEPAYVACAEPGPLNRLGLKVGAFMCWAPQWRNVPQAVLGGGSIPAQFLGQAKAANAAVRREFREIVAAGTRGRRVGTAQDSHGRQVRLDNALPAEAAAGVSAPGAANGGLHDADSSRAVAGPAGRPRAETPAASANVPEPDMDALARAEARALAKAGVLLGAGA